MRKIVIIVAGGSGSRMQSELPKQFLELEGKPILMHTIERFYNYSNDMEIRVVLPADQTEYWKTLVQEHDFQIPHKLYKGGETRFHSVKNGLQEITENTIVAIHDGVRPMVSNETIQRTFEEAEQRKAAIPIVDVYETIRELNSEGSNTVDRDKYKLVQTPQVFQSGILLKAYKQSYHENFTDDASVVESSGGKIFLVKGNRENIKITTPNDLIYAEAIYGRL